MSIGLFNLFELEKRLRLIPTNTVQEYFLELRKIIDEINSNYRATEEDLCYSRENLQLLKEELEEKRKELNLLRRTIVELKLKYESSCEAVIRRLAEDDELIAKIKNVSSMQKQLDSLSWKSMLFSIKRDIKMSLIESDYTRLSCALKEIKDLENNFLNNEVQAKETKTVIDEVKGSLTSALSESLTDVKYPFEFDIDIRAVKEVTDQVIMILKCLLLATNKSDSERKNEILDLLFEPFHKRFLFHFETSRKTNVDSKPEWYFTQVITWINANIEFLEEIFLHIFTNEEEARMNLNKFLRKFVDLLKNKVRNVLMRISADSSLFSHLLDECIAFENDLQGIVHPSLVGLVLEIFCGPSYINHWLQLEEQCCTANIENLLLVGEDKWKSRYQHANDVDLHNVPECTDHFILLVESITLRYRLIRDANVQARFLKLQILLLDEFRLRLIQISQQLTSPWEEPFIQILNSFWYIASTLDRWNEFDTFIRIQVESKQVCGRAIFEDIINMYKHIWSQRANDMANVIYQRSRVQLAYYEKSNWFSLKANKNMELTPSFCPFLLEIRAHMMKVSSVISKDSATMLYRLLNAKIAEALIQSINSISFNCHGASQMFYDICAVLIPVLNSFYKQTSEAFEVLDEPKFIDILSSLKLLSLPTPTSILLYNELKRIPDEMAPSVLSPYDLSTLNRSRAIDLFKQRCDLKLEDDVALFG